MTSKIPIEIAITSETKKRERKPSLQNSGYLETQLYSCKSNGFLTMSEEKALNRKGFGLFGQQVK
tara:strand:- start:522 stop:716 length:195 start_codon:yes stop_codon:yes gene_type:complete